METTINKELHKVLKGFDNRYFLDEELNKNKVIQDLEDCNPKLLQALLSNDLLKKYFTMNIEGHTILQTSKLIELFELNDYWKSSYTRYSKKIGLTTNGKFIDESTDVVLDFPYKDTVLKASMSKEDTDQNDLRPDEPFLNEVIAKEEIDQLFEEKIFLNVKKYDEKGSHKVCEFNINDNLVIKGNNLIALHTLKKKYVGKINFIYIDPPFNTGSDSFKYNDNFNQSSWLTFMKNRLMISKELLSEDGNIAIHLDWNQSHYLKVLADSIFGKKNFLNEIIWSYEKWTAASKNLQKNHDVILVYSKNKGVHKFNIVKEMTKNLQEKYKKGYLLGGGGGSKGLIVYDKTNKKAQELISSGRYKVVYAEAKGKPLSDVWYIPFINPGSHERTGFNSQKPEKLIKRILKIFTDEGDIVLDFHLGSGTTSAVAHKMGRQYIGIEQMDYINTITVPRLQKVINSEQSGVSKAVDWQGGGSFVYAELMEKNRGFIKMIQEAEDPLALQKIFDFMLEEAEIDFRVDLEEVKDTLHELSFEDQKKIIFAIIDKNQLYYNYSEIDDENVRDLLADEDYAFNKSFYEEGEE